MEDKYKRIITEMKEYMKKRIIDSGTAEESREELLNIFIKLVELEAK